MTMPSAPTWVDILTPNQCPCCGQAVMPTPQDYLDAFTTSVDQFTSSMSQWMGGAGVMTTAPDQPASGTVTRRHMGQRGSRMGGPMAGAPFFGWGTKQSAGSSVRGHQHHAGCGCGCHDNRGDRGCGCGQWSKRGGCRQDDCHCRCCIGDDIDLVVYSRVGERRVVPITISNERRRERDVTLELSAFKSKGGRDVPVKGAIVGASKFVLAPCEERAVTIVVTSSEPGSSVGDVSTQTPTDVNAPTPTDVNTPTPTDVDDCLVAVADLRVEGCDIRCPIGIAVVLLPLDCDTFDVKCACGCC
jgi:hypothetical protein